MNGTFTSPTVPVNATINTTSLTPGRHIIFVRGRGVNQYQGYDTWGPMTATWLWINGTCAPGPDYLVSSATGQSIVPGTNQVPGSTCNACTVTLDLPFSYTFYDTAFTQVNASTNGTLQFVSNSSSGANTCLPTAILNDTIMAYWDDMNANINDLMGIYTSTTGTAPNRIFNIEWRVGYVANDVRPNFEVRLYEGQPKFEVIYGQTRNGFSATVGVQQDNGAAHYTQYECDTNGTIQPGQKLTFDLRACD
jgi:hypothetical protein